jgi:Tfp pilus assembly protein PilF
MRIAEMTSQQRSVPAEGPPKPAVLAQLARIQASSRFANAPRLCQLLAYLVEHSAAGNRRDLQEFAIGMDVFGRGDGFDPQSDTIVRVTVRRLRQRLADYYGNEGRDDRVRFHLPVGHYRVAVSMTEPAAQPGLRAWVPRRRNRLVLPAAVCAVLAVLGIVGYAGRPGAAGNPADPPDPETMQHVLLGQQLLHRRGTGDAQQAADEFEQAVAIDAGIVDAWIGLAWALRVRPYETFDEFEETLPRQYEALQRALALDPNHPEANARMAVLRRSMGDRSGAARYMARALEFGRDNNLVLSIIAGEERAGGNLQRAIELQREANRFPPLDSASFNNLAYMLYEAGEFDEAVDTFYATAKITPIEPVVTARLVRALILKGELKQAEQVLKELPPGADRQQALALIHYAAGRKEASDRALQVLAGQPRSRNVSIELAEAFAFRGEYDRAMDEIESAYEQMLAEEGPPSRHCHDIQLLLNSPFFVTMSVEPRFRAWADKAEAFVADARPELLTMAALEREASLW